MENKKDEINRLSTKTKNSLLRAGITCAKDIPSRNKLITTPGIGVSGIAEIAAKITRCELDEDTNILVCRRGDVVELMLSEDGPLVSLPMSLFKAVLLCL